MGERLDRTQEVGGSIPPCSTRQPMCPPTRTRGQRPHRPATDVLRQSRVMRPRREDRQAGAARSCEAPRRPQLRGWSARWSRSAAAAACLTRAWCVLGCGRTPPPASDASRCGPFCRRCGRRLCVRTRAGRSCSRAAREQRRQCADRRLIDPDHRVTTTCRCAARHRPGDEPHPRRAACRLRRDARPRLVAALGACALGCGVLGDPQEMLGGLERVLPVAIRIPGCPPTPSEIARHLLDGLDAVRGTGGPAAPEPPRAR